MQATLDCDTLIVGSGPHALAVVARLLEKFPESVINDEEHGRLTYWQKRYGNSKRVNNSPVAGRIKVVDPSGTWLHRWDRQFSMYGIYRLRSPSFFHPDPSSIDGLRAFAQQHGRLDELFEVQDLFDSSQTHQTKHRRQKGQRRRGAANSILNEVDRLRFALPTTKLFGDFCRSLIDRYHLEELVHQGYVRQIVPCTFAGQEEESDSEANFMEVHIDQSGNRKIIRARRVIIAIGTANRPFIPDWARPLFQHNHPGRQSILHAFDLLQTEPEMESSLQCQLPFTLQDKIRANQRPGRLLIVGGGLTSAHLCVLAARKLGILDITLVSRKQLRVKHFDAVLEWIGRHRHVEFSKFYTQSWQDRLRTIREAREGGSITPEMMSKLNELQEEGVLQLRSPCIIQDCKWSEQENRWRVSIGKCTVEADPSQLENSFDMIWLATGSNVQVQEEPVFQGLIQAFPIETEQGWPVLTADLQWHSACPNVYVMGGYAALQLGPNALNLVGARSAAERISACIESLGNREADDRDSGFDSGSEDGDAILSKTSNYFSILSSLS